MPKLAQKSGDLADVMVCLAFKRLLILYLFRLRCLYILQLELGGLSGYVSLTSSATLLESAFRLKHN
jgi:hypothetical protein